MTTIHTEAWNPSVPASSDIVYWDTWDSLGTAYRLQFEQWDSNSLTWHAHLKRRWNQVTFAPVFSDPATGEYLMEPTFSYDGLAVKQFMYGGVPTFDADTEITKGFAITPGSTSFSADFYANDAGSGLHAINFHPERYEFYYTRFHRTGHHAFFDDRTNFAVRTLIRLNNKNTTMPIILTNRFVLFYDKPTDRFVFSAMSVNIGVGSIFGALETQTKYDAMTQRVVASTFGSPSAGVYYQIVFQFDALNNKLLLRVNSTTEESANVSLPFTRGDNGVLFFGGIFGNQTIDIRDPGWAAQRKQGFWFDGRMSETVTWSRLLTTSESASLHNGGVFKAWPFGV